MRGIGVLLGFVIVAAARDACAQSSGTTAAEALFDEGRRLVQAGEIAAGCAKLSGSYAIEPALGTLLNLADCQERLGRLATAWTQYRDAVAWARREGDPKREALAERRATALEPRLPRLILEVEEGEGTAALVVEVDGKEWPRATWGSAVPIDPGAHVVAARAPGFASYEGRITIDGPGARESLRVPALRPSGSVAKPQVTPAPHRKATRRASEPPRSKSRPRPAVPPVDDGSTRRTLAWTTGALGVAGVALGAFFGLRASSRWDEAQRGCAEGQSRCTPEAAALGADADRDATWSTLGFALGGAALGVSTWLFVTAAPSASNRSAQISIQGRF